MRECLECQSSKRVTFSSEQTETISQEEGRDERKSVTILLDEQDPIAQDPSMACGRFPTPMEFHVRTESIPSRRMPSRRPISQKAMLLHFARMPEVYFPKVGSCSLISTDTEGLHRLFPWPFKTVSVLSASDCISSSNCFQLS